MQEKVIKQVIRKKITQWLETIDDIDVRNAINKDLIITGGCFPSMILNETPKDFDCYFRTKQTTLLVANYYATKWNEAHKSQTNKIGHQTKIFVLDGANPSPELLSYYNVDTIDKSQSRMIANCPPERIKMIFPSDGIVGDPEEANASEELGVDLSTVELVTELDEVEADKIEQQVLQDYFPVFISSNAITLSRGIQIVVRFYGEPNDIHDTYDFEHTKAYYDFGKSELCIPNKVYECVINKTLIYAGSKYPVCSVFRLRKFISRGWTINAGQILKMCMQISELDLTNIDVLEDQLVGVDSLYFMNLIDQFRKMKESDPTFKIDSTYIMSIVDKIF